MKTETDIIETDKLYYLIVNRKELYDRARALGYPNVLLRETSFSDSDIQVLSTSGKSVILLFYCSEGEDLPDTRQLKQSVRENGKSFYMCELNDYMAVSYGVNSVTIGEICEKFLSPEKLEKMLSRNGYILSEDYDQRCGNCHGHLESGDKYCRYCGTERGKGRFLPYKNTTGSLYGPPVKVKTKCRKCGYIWVSGYVGGDYSSYCPHCSTDAISVLEDRAIDWFDEYIGTSEPYDTKKNTPLLTEKQIVMLRELHGEYPVKTSEKNHDHWFEWDAFLLEYIGIEVPDKGNRWSLTERQADQLNLAKKILQIKGDYPGRGNRKCDKCGSRMTAAIKYELRDEGRKIYKVICNQVGNQVTVEWYKPIKHLEDMVKQKGYRCLNCGNEFERVWG